MAVAAGAFYYLLPELAKASGSWQTVLAANWAWFLVVLAASALTYVASAIALAGCVTIRLIVGVVVAVVSLILATRRGRQFAVGKILPALRSSLANLREVARRPAKLTLLFGGSVLVTLAYIGGLVAAVEAFGGPVSIAAIGAAYLASAAVAAASATPGGIGTFEATLTASLIAIGIQPNVAVPVVISYRLATYWLPVAPGWAALHLLQRRDLI